MPLGTPSYLQEYDLLVARSGAMVPAGLTIGGAYTWTAVQSIDLGTGPSGITESNSAFTMRGANAAALNIYSEMWGVGNGVNWHTYAAGGTRAVPTATPNGYGFLTVNARGHNGTAYTGTVGYYSLYAGSLWTGSSYEVLHEWTGTSSGSTSQVVWLRLRTTGQIQQLSGTAPTANTFSGNVLFGVNNATADIAGQCGETTTSTVSGVAVAATGTVGNVTSISLTAGKWEIKGFVVISGGATGLTAASTAKMSIVTTTATNGTSGSTMTQESVYALVANGLVQMSIPAVIVNITSTTTYYMTEEVTYAAGSPTVSGTIVATRIR